ncbi:hypothetical protein M514_03360 [Trichuris suis]|uniref:[histone H3]-lysine(27) N-trimethyltransferase n=1 Tax=Trichuris suis TaxID=68888 RepID=A0A085NEX7_9BILA|nr:hypothetical protein M513_03360 [Trichuris suis]KFD68023.1 hypothetical protein M514_03360 [Trichuris suis]
MGEAFGAGMEERRKHVFRDKREFCKALLSMMHKVVNPLDCDSQNAPRFWKDESYNYCPAFKKFIASEKWDFDDGTEQGSHRSSGESRLRELIDQVLVISPPNGSNMWIYVKNNIMGAESREATAVPVEGIRDQKLSRQFLLYYKFGPRMRFGEAGQVFNDDQLYRLVEKVYKKMMESSAADQFLSARSTLFCCPMPPSKVFEIIAKVRPSLGSPETIQTLYFNALTDPLERRVNKASEMADNHSPSANQRSWFLQLACPMCLRFGCPSHEYGVYSNLLRRTASCCQGLGNELNGMATNLVERFRLRANERSRMRRSDRGIVINRKSVVIVRNEHSCTARIERFDSVEIISRHFSNDNFNGIGSFVGSEPFPFEHTLLSKLRIGTKPVLWKKKLHVVHRSVDGDGSEQAYKPCFCVESCVGSACSCSARGFCEKYCCCSASCIIRFPGCRCHTSCDTKCCPCFVADRECDADLCISCFTCEEDYYSDQEISYLQCTSRDTHPRAITNGTISSNEHSFFLRFKQLAQKDPEKPVHFRCKNLALQMGNAKELFVGDSDVHGIGVFAAEDLEAGDFICEYAGEIITQAEADRRGTMYDYTGKSYLFTLNKEFDIDATRFGNEARFINHSSKPNCEPRVKLVYGSQRIGIYATTSIKKYSELFFNYRYSKKDGKSYPNLI